MSHHMILQAIETRFLGPTDRRGSRVKAIAAAGSVTVNWKHSLNANDNHAIAAHALAAKFDWRGVLAQGVLASGNHVFVFTSRE